MLRQTGPQLKFHRIVTLSAAALRRKPLALRTPSKRTAALGGTNAHIWPMWSNAR